MDAPAVAQELQTRFLYPFFFRRNTALAAGHDVLAAAAPDARGHSTSLWTACTWGSDQLAQLYREELLDHAGRFLFGSPDEASCQYFRLADRFVNFWLDDLGVSFSSGTLKGQRLAVRSVSGAGVELFLTNYGVGVLSIALQLLGAPIVACVEFNYRLARLGLPILSLLGKPHPNDDPARAARLTAADRERLAPPPPAEAPLVERLGRRGGTFALAELIELLLRPLSAFDLRPAQERLSVYTAARFGDAVDFEQAAVRRALSPALSGLAAVEESDHAGVPAGSVSVSNAILDRRHWAAVGLLGAAHLIADQPGNHSFNPARMPHVMLKYFAPYVLAMLQRLVLQRLADEAGRLIRSAEPPAKGLPQLRRDALDFAANGCFAQVSSREALHRYYRLAQDGLDVHAIHDDVHTAIAEWDAQWNEEQRLALSEENARVTQALLALQHDAAERTATMVRLQETSARSLAAQAALQGRVEYIEIFIVAVYAMELWERVARDVCYLDAVPSYAFALLCGIVATLILRPWRH